MKRALLTMIIGLAMAACGSGDDGGSGGGGGGNSKSCDVKVQTLHTCSTYTATGLTDQQVQQYCTAAMGSVVKSCSTSGLAGVCTVSSGAAAAKQYFYAPYTADQVKQACTAGGGTFSTSSAELDGNDSAL